MIAGVVVSVVIRITIMWVVVAQMATAALLAELALPVVKLVIGMVACDTEW